MYFLKVIGFNEKFSVIFERKKRVRGDLTFVGTGKMEFTIKSRFGGRISSLVWSFFSVRY